MNLEYIYSDSINSEEKEAGFLDNIVEEISKLDKEKARAIHEAIIILEDDKGGIKQDGK